jgi:hypothetical protein
MESFSAGNFSNRPSQSLSWIDSKEMHSHQQAIGRSTFDINKPIASIRPRSSIDDADHRWGSTERPTELQQHKLIYGLPRITAPTVETNRQAMIREQRRFERDMRARGGSVPMRVQAPTVSDELAKANAEIARLREGIRSRDSRLREAGAVPASRAGPRQRIRPMKSKSVFESLGSIFT